MSLVRIALGAGCFAPALCLVSLLCGCASGPEASLRSMDRVSTFGANPQFDNERYEMVDLITLLDPDNRRSGYSIGDKKIHLFTLTATETTTDSADAEARQQLALAEIAFYHLSYGDPNVRRNRIQDRLIGASNQRCSAYKTYLNRFDAYQQSGFGSATTVLGGAAGIVSGVKDARILGGLAGISSGVQAEIAQGFLGNLASYVIVPGMELRRKTILEEIRNRRTASGNDYTLQAALADAARYHGACTLVVGLEQAKEAIQTVENPGMRMMAVTLNNVLQTRAMQKTIAKQETGPVTPEDLIIPAFRLNDQPVAAATGQAGVRLTSIQAAPSSDPTEDLARRALDLSVSVLGEAQSRIEVLGKQLQELQGEIDSPTPGALTAKLKTLRAALVPRVDQMKAAKQAMNSMSTANAGVIATAQACLVKLDQRLRVAEPADRTVASADLDLGIALVKNRLTEWLFLTEKGFDTWSRQLRDNIDATSLKSLKASTAGNIDVDKLVSALDVTIANGKTIVTSFPAIDFKMRGITACG